MPKQLQQYCKYGHDTFICGRVPSSKTCRECSRSRVKKRAKLPEGRMYHRDQQREYRKSLEGRYKSYRADAKQRDIPFELTLEQFKTFWGKECVFGCLMIESIGLDRINNSEGYVVSNLQPMCQDHNRMKNNHSDKRFNELIAAAYKYPL